MVGEGGGGGGRILILEPVLSGKEIWDMTLTFPKVGTLTLPLGAAERSGSREAVLGGEPGTWQSCRIFMNMGFIAAPVKIQVS